jgi:L-asparaginase II
VAGTFSVADSVELAVVERSGFIESRHAGSAIVLSPEGEVLRTLGDVTTPIFPRSCLKPFQAVAVMTSGVTLRGEDAAIATASHSGTAAHVALVRKLLERASLPVSALGCPPAAPTDKVARDELIRSGAPRDRVYMNCSGKHAAMLNACVENGWSLDDYLDPAHPLQQAIAEIVEDLTGQAIARVTVDGCGAPLFSVSLHGLARAAARITTAPPGTPEARVADAMREHAEMASGTGRDVAALMRAVPGLLTKDGFEGVQVAALPDGRAVAVKIADGADRARVPVTAAALARCGVDPAALTEFAGAPLLGGGAVVGSIRPARALDPLAE